MKEYNFKINGNDYTVGIEILNDTEADVIVNGASYSVEVLDTTVKPVSYTHLTLPTNSRV